MKLSAKVHSTFKSVLGPWHLRSIFGAFLTTIALFPHLAMAAPPVPEEDRFVKGRILVETNPGLSPSELGKIVGAYGGKARKIGHTNIHIVDLPGNASEKAIVQRLAHNPHLRFAELDREVPSSFIPNDPTFGSEWHLAKIGASTAWDYNLGAGVVIAILDSGVETSHPDLSARMVPGFNIYNNNTDVTDICGHGTAVAGAAAASVNNGIGVAGVAGSARIMPLRIAYWNTTYNSCYASYSTIASGITYAADHGARIANVSYARTFASSSILSASRYMKSKGGLVIASAGNSNVDENVALDSAMIVVSATTSSDAKASFSSYGAMVSVAAPGSGIWTTGKGGVYKSVNGTSFSAPITAGVVALMMSANPSLGPDKIQSLLYSTAVDLGTAGRDNYFGYGRVNAAAATQAAYGSVVAIDSLAPTVSLSGPAAGSTVSGIVSIQASASDNIGVSRVELQVNGKTIATDSASPYSFSWDTKLVANGSASLVAKAFDAAGNVGSSNTLSLSVSNVVVAPAPAPSPTPSLDTTAPVISIVSPVAGKVVGNVTISTSVSDNSGAAGITQSIYVDGVLKASGSGSSLSVNWNTRKISAGNHTILVVAKDAAGNSASKSVIVTKY